MEIATGLLAGGGPTARLSALPVASSVLEMLLVADDLDGARGERYGCMNRAIADDQGDDEADLIAIRLARFDDDALARTKSVVTT